MKQDAPSPASLVEKGKIVGDGDWVPYIPDRWSLEEIICENIDRAIKDFISELRLISITEKPGEMMLYGAWDTITKCGSLRDAFEGDLRDWGPEYGSEAGPEALAWADYLESLAADIRAAHKQNTDSSAA